MKLYSQTQGHGPLLVLLHGWGFNHAVWQSLVPHLSEHYTVINIDLPGFGHSTFASHIDTLASFSEAILSVIPDRAILMGWSLGGLVAQYLALQHPNQITQLIAVASTPCFIKHPHWPGVSADLLENFANELNSNYQKILQRFINLQFFGTEVDRALIKRLHEEIIQTPPNTTALQFGLKLLLESDLRAQLHEIHCPIRFILGKLDVLVPAGLAELLPKLNQNTKIQIIKGAGHAPFISHPEEFLAATGLMP